MAVYNAWTVEYLNGSTWTAISNVQDLSCQVGRQTAVDQWPVSQASIRIWYPEGYASPLANLTIGTYIRFFAPGRSSTKPSWTGLVRNVTLEVGIPWNSSTSDGNADFLVIDCEGHYAQAGRQTQEWSRFMGPAAFNGTWAQIAIDLRNTGGFVFNYDTAAPGVGTLWFFGNDPSVDQFWNFTPSELLVQMIALTNWRLCDGVKKTWAAAPGNTDDPAIYVGAPYATSSYVTSVGFSDTTNNSTNRIYDQTTFDGLADLYYTQAIITYDNPSTGNSQTATDSVGSAPYRTYATQGPANPPTISGSANSTLVNYTNQAQYLANAFNPADIGISSISATTAGQHTQNLDTLGVTDLELGYLPLYVVPVTLRGTTFYAQIEGVSITADTNQARFTYYVTPTGTSGWFTLDSTPFGVLDQNRLGIY